jgi:hypothetical protein
MRPSTDRDEAGSLPIAILVTLVGLMLSTLLVNTAIQQVTTTKSEISRVAALNAAQAGLDVGLAHIRAANDGAGAGVLGSLPCGSLTGTLAAVGTSTQASYQVAVDYYPTDPQSRTASWLATNKIACLTGGGAFSTPAYGLLVATGTYVPGSASVPVRRTLRATYTFRTTDLNIPGGLVHEYRTSTSAPDLCWDAGSGSPAAGTAVGLEACTAGSVRQTWGYNANLTISLISSKTTTQPLGVCLDAGTPHAVDQTVYVQACSTTTLPQQQWSYNDSSNWEGTADGATLDGYCLNAQTPTIAGGFLVLGSVAAGTCRGGNGTRTVFYPDTTVGAGAGAAGPKASQLVDFKQFGRCLDVTNQQVNAAFLIAWACKQAPDPNNVTWNQKWALPEVPDGATGVNTILTTNPSSGLYCLSSPRSIVSYQYVTVVSCTAASMGAELKWTFYGNTGVYATSYTVVDVDGHCLSPTDPSAPSPDLFSGGQVVSKIIVASCDGSTLQKWNAPSSILSALPLKDINEQ